MQSVIISVGIILWCIQTALATAVTLEPRSLVEHGFKCGNVFISGSKLIELSKAIKRTSRLKYIFPLVWRNEFSNYYNGPPFTKRYLLWPVSPTTNSYKKAAKTPYRAVLDENYEVFSVIIKNKDRVKECNLNEQVPRGHYVGDFNCDGQPFFNRNLVAATEAICPKFDGFATGIYPARYDGPHFESYGKQRYIYPILPHEHYDSKQAPGRYRVVLNSACKFVGVVMDFPYLGYVACYQYKYPHILN